MAGKGASSSLKPCSNGSMESEAFTGKEFSLKRCTIKSIEDIDGKQASSLKLCPAECMSMGDISGDQAPSLKLCPTESLRMEYINGRQECSLKMCPTKRKPLTAGHLPPLKGGAIKRKGEEYCSEGDIAVFPEDVDKCADVTMDEIEEQVITKVAAASHHGAPATGFSEEEEDEEFEWSTDEEGVDGDAILSKAEFQLVLDRADAKFNRFVERLRARNKTILVKSYTAADFVDSDDEEVVRDHAKVEVAL
ncbi:hypothetical protein ACUV84_019610 [Puccinellia chinampoensis]